MKQEACSQILYFLFRDLQRAYESKNRGGFIEYKRKEGGGGERRKKTVYGHHWSNVIGIANAEVIMTRRWHWEGHLINLVLPKDVHRHSFPFFRARCQILGKKSSVGRLWNKGKWFFFSNPRFLSTTNWQTPKLIRIAMGILLCPPSRKTLKTHSYLMRWDPGWELYLQRAGNFCTNKRKNLPSKERLVWNPCSEHVWFFHV